MSRGSSKVSMHDRKKDPKEKSNDQSKRNESKVNEIVREAYTWLGTKYVYGGHSKSGTDCSGMVMEVFLKVLNLKLPRSSQEQQAYCRPIERNCLLPGDLIFFCPGTKNQVSHVGIYIGDNNMIHASASQGVMVSNIYENYFVRHYHSSGHVDGLDNGNSEPRSVSSSLSSTPLPTSSRSIHIDDLEKVLETKTDSILSIYMD